MKISRILSVVLCFLLINSISFSQDIRLLETKVADLLAQFPANDAEYTNRLMGDMISLGEEGIKLICSKVIPYGTGDDTKARFAVESLSRFLSRSADRKQREMWETICLTSALEQRDSGVKDFFMKQLQLIGGERSVESLKTFLPDKENCSPAIAAIQSIGGKTAEVILAESLKNKELPCASQVMNALAGMNSQLAVNEYIEWTSVGDADTKASAYNALAQSGSPLAYPVLSGAAREEEYRWEPAGATSALLDYAKNVGQNGDIKTMDKICKLVMNKCNDKSTIQNKTSALMIFVDFHGIDAMKEIFNAAGNPDNTYRNAAIISSLDIPGQEVVTKWIKFFPKSISEAKPEIIGMLGKRGDESALPLIKSSLSDPDIAVRKSAARALARISGKKAVPDLINYMVRYTDPGDQEAAKSALMTLSGDKEIDLLKPVLKEGDPAAKKSAIELIAWNRNKENFEDVLSFISSDDENVKSAAFKALADLAGPEDQEKLIELISVITDTTHVKDVQNAIASAALQTDDPVRSSVEILKAIEDKSWRYKVIPVLARTGGRKALSAVLKEFENGNPEMRDICFKTLTSWKDYTASSALYEICASGNKTFEEPAFKSYVHQVRSSDLPDEQKLLLYRKIMTLAKIAERKNEILTELGSLKTCQTLFFVNRFLDDPETSATAARAAMLIALPADDSETGMYGTLVREILFRAGPMLTGPENEYEKEMLSKYIASMPDDEGFMPMFNGKDLTGWQGLVENPVARAKMTGVDLERKQAEANVMVPASWSVKDGCIWFNGKGENLCSIAEYGDFEMLADWKISKGGDSGIYLRGTPQVQIWDTSRTDTGAQVGSGGLYNNIVNQSKPLKVADNPVGEWNSFRIVMTGEKVTVWLNGELVVDNVVMENYWDSKIPIFSNGPIELQAHGTNLAFRDLYIRKISEKEFNLTPGEKTEGFVALFNGKNLDNWTGNKQSYIAEDGMIVINPEDGSGGNLYTEKEYSDFIFRFEFQLTPAANNGLGIRAPLEGDAAYAGMELQILDDTSPVYAAIEPYQHHGSVYGVIPARRGFLKPVGEWNYEEVVAEGTHIKITLNGTVIVDGDIADPRDNGTMDHKDHPGLKNKTGHIGFLGHGSVVKFRNIRIKDLSD